MRKEYEHMTREELIAARDEFYGVNKGIGQMLWFQRRTRTAADTAYLSRMDAPVSASERRAGFRPWTDLLGEREG